MQPPSPGASSETWFAVYFVMTLEPLPLAGAFRVKFPRFDDERGYFRRTFSRAIFADAGLADCTLECSLAFNARRGTLRGMHFQRAPHGETKFIYAVSGAVFDVIVDLRPHSATYGRWHAEELSSENTMALYVPRDFAHGYLTLTDAAIVAYQMDTPYVPSAASGVAWNDPEIGIAWPFAPLVIGARDRTWPGLRALTPAEPSGS
jgi:dTDP-4-dehydrorhamnose 3,5-epimerase